MKKNVNNNHNNFRNNLNEEFYPLIRNNKNINPIDINMINIIVDGNCLYRWLARFVYGNEELHQRVRNEIYNKAIIRLPNYPNISLENENGPMNIIEYANHINNDDFYWGN